MLISWKPRWKRFELTPEGLANLSIDERLARRRWLFRKLNRCGKRISRSIRWHIWLYVTFGIGKKAVVGAKKAE